MVDIHHTTDLRLLTLLVTLDASQSETAHLQTSRHRAATATEVGGGACCGLCEALAELTAFALQPWTASSLPSLIAGPVDAVVPHYRKPYFYLPGCLQAELTMVVSSSDVAWLRTAALCPGWV